MSGESLTHKLLRSHLAAGELVPGIDWFEMASVRGHLANGQVADWQVTVKIGFRLEDAE